MNFALSKILGQQRLHFCSILLQIHSGNCLQKIAILDLSLIKLLQNQEGCNFYESKKSPFSGLRLSGIFSQTVDNVKSIFTHLLCVPIYARLQIFIQLSPTLTKLCDYLVHIICSKCPAAAEMHAFRRLRKSLIALLSVASHPRSAAFIMSTNMLDTI